MKFFDKFSETLYFNQSLLCFSLNPDLEFAPKQCSVSQTDSFPLRELQEWLHLLIAETADLVCAYKLTLEFYQVLGSAGFELLHQTLAAIPKHIPVILDAKHSDARTSSIFAETIFSTWQVDAVTLNPYMGQDEVAPFLLYPDKAVFILCATANPSAAVLQEYPTVSSPFYLNLAREAITWGSPEQLGLSVGGSPETLSRIRQVAPEQLILVDDLSPNAKNFEQILSVGLTHNNNGLILSVSQELSGSRFFRDSLRSLRDSVNQIKATVIPESPACSVWVSDVCLLQQNPHTDLILQLYDVGCIHFGEFVQASGATFPYYIDLRTIISHPQVFEQVLSAYAEILKTLMFDRIAGIPYGSLPTATGLGLRLNTPMIFPRKEVKAHGTRRLIEGKFQEGETVVVIDDILITGKSILEGIEKLKSVGLVVKDAVVLVDHEEGVCERLEKQGYRSHAVLTMTGIAQTLYEAGRLDAAQLNTLLGNRHSNQGV